jgi:hypothetical protein
LYKELHAQWNQVHDEVYEPLDQRVEDLRKKADKFIEQITKSFSKLWRFEIDPTQQGALKNQTILKYKAILFQGKRYELGAEVIRAGLNRQSGLEDLINLHATLIKALNNNSEKVPEQKTPAVPEEKLGLIENQLKNLKVEESDNSDFVTPYCPAKLAMEGKTDKPAAFSVMHGLLNSSDSVTSSNNDTTSAINALTIVDDQSTGVGQKRDVSMAFATLGVSSAEISDPKRQKDDEDVDYFQEKRSLSIDDSELAMTNPVALVMRGLDRQNLEFVVDNFGKDWADYSVFKKVSSMFHRNQESEESSAKLPEYYSTVGFARNQPIEKTFELLAQQAFFIAKERILNESKTQAFGQVLCYLIQSSPSEFKLDDIVDLLNLVGKLSII